MTERGLVPGDIISITSRFEDQKRTVHRFPRRPLSPHAREHRRLFPRAQSPHSRQQRGRQEPPARRQERRHFRGKVRRTGRSHPRFVRWTSSCPARSRPDSADSFTSRGIHYRKGSYELETLGHRRCCRLPSSRLGRRLRLERLRQATNAPPVSLDAPGGDAHFHHLHFRRRFRRLLSADFGMSASAPASSP